MQTAPFNIVISGKRYECRVAGNTEAEAADTAELIMHQLRQQDRIWPARVNIECEDFAAAKRLAAYFAAITVEPDLGWFLLRSGATMQHPDGFRASRPFRFLSLHAG